MAISICLEQLKRSDCLTFDMCALSAQTVVIPSATRIEFYACENVMMAAFAFHYDVIERHYDNWWPPCHQYIVTIADSKHTLRCHFKTRFHSWSKKN